MLMVFRDNASLFVRRARILMVRQLKTPVKQAALGVPLFIASKTPQRKPV